MNGPLALLYGFCIVFLPDLYCAEKKKKANNQYIGNNQGQIIFKNTTGRNCNCFLPRQNHTFKYRKQKFRIIVAFFY